MSLERRYYFIINHTTNKGITKGDGHLYKYVLADLTSVSSYDFNI